MLLPSPLQKLRDFTNDAAARLAWLPPTVARVALGVVFVETGWGKLHSLAGVTRYFAELGIPFPGIQAPLVSTIELVGGLLLILGLATRLAALPLIGTMVVAILTAQRAQIHGPGDLFGLVEFAYLTIFLWLAIAGAGRFSLDHLLARRRAVQRAVRS
jgi:putative oxidoreductase